MSFRLHRRCVGDVGTLLWKLRHGQQRPVSMGIVGNKRGWRTMSGSDRNAGLQSFRLPYRLFDGRMASLELLLSHVRGSNSATDPCHCGVGRNWRHRMPQHDRNLGMRIASLSCGLCRDVVESVGYLQCTVQCGQLSTLALC